MTASPSEKKRLRLLDDAANYICETGFGQTNLDQLSQHCGVTRKTLKRHFGDKQSLFLEVIEHILANNMQLSGLGDTAEVEIRPQLILFSYSYLKSLYSPPIVALLRETQPRSAESSELTEYFIDRVWRDVREKLQSFISEQVASGIIDISNTERASRQLLGSLTGYHLIDALYAGHRPSDEELEQTAEAVIDAFLLTYSDDI